MPDIPKRVLVVARARGTGPVDRGRYALVRSAVLIVSVGSLVLGLPVTASATTGTMTITEDTTLTEDHFGSIEIAADGITLDCAGFRLTGPSSADWPVDGVLIDHRSDVTIANCTASGFVNGFKLQGATDSTLSGNTASANEGNGFYIDAGSSSNVLIGNVAVDNVVGHGFTIESGSDGNLLEDGTASGNAGNGVQVYLSKGNTLRGNTVTGNAVDGIVVSGSDANTIRGNVVTGNPFAGIHLDSSNANSVIENTVQGNGSTGIVLDSSDGNVLKRNRSVGNGVDAESSGFWLKRSSRNVLRDNVSSDNTYDGFDISVRSNRNILEGNEAVKNVLNGIDISRAERNTVSDSHLVGNFRGLYASRASGLLAEANVASGNGGFGFEAHGSSDMTWLENSAVRNAGGGFLLSEVKGSTFEGNTARNTGGFRIDASSGNEFVRNVSARNDGVGFNLVDGSDGNVFRSSEASRNGDSGFVIDGSGGNLVRDSVADDNGVGGFYVLTGSADNRLVRNDACGNGELDALDIGSGTVWSGNVLCTSDI